MLPMEFASIFLLISFCWGVFGSMDCKCTTLGKDYIGKKNTTASGIPCQRWDVQTPHVPCEKCTGLTGSENYCRNPDDGTLGPWCYTMDPNIRWEYCDISYCNGFDEKNECKYTKEGIEYQGKRNTTLKGILCRKWQDSKSALDWLESGCPENYCRNPDNSPEGPWCYTMDPNVNRYYCDVPYCNTREVVRKTYRHYRINYDGELIDESFTDSRILCISKCLSLQRCSVAIFDEIQSKCLLKQERLGGTLYNDLTYDTYFLSFNIEDCN